MPKKYQSVVRWLDRWIERYSKYTSPNPLRPPAPTRNRGERGEASYPTIRLSNYPIASRFARAFSLVELLLSLFFISTFVIILLSSTLVLKTRFATDKHVLANRAASKEIERLRNMNWDNLIVPAQGDTNDWPPGGEYNDEKASLEKGSTGPAGFNRNVNDYENGGEPTSQTKIIKVDITITWDTKGGLGSTTYQTLISKDGLHGS